MMGFDLILTARLQVEAKTKWRHQGREAGVALDCVGLLYHVAYMNGLNVEDIRNYSMRPGSTKLYETLAQYADKIALDQPRKPGDILVVSINGEDPQHTALWTGEGTVIHSSAKHRRVVEHRFDEDMRRGLCAIYRLRGLDG